MAEYKVEGSGCTYLVTLDGKTIMGPFTSWGRAEDMRDELVRKSRMTMRPCITCNTDFLSEGAHNRMCDQCRVMASGMVA